MPTLAGKVAVVEEVAVAVAAVVAVVEAVVMVVEVAVVLVVEKRRTTTIRRCPRLGSCPLICSISRSRWRRRKERTRRCRRPASFR
jgi:hypothetical protein